MDSQFEIAAAKPVMRCKQRDYVRAYVKSRMDRIKATETPEQREARKLKNRERSSRWYHADQERKKRLYLKHREKYLKYQRERYRNPEIGKSLRAYQKKRYLENECARELIRSRARIQSKTDRAGASRRNKTYYHKNKPKFLAASHLRRARQAAVTVNLKGINRWFKHVKSRSESTCYYCQKVIPVSDVHFEHIVPISRGGEHSLSNLAVTCSTCNYSKNNRLVSEWKKSGQLIFSI